MRLVIRYSLTVLYRVMPACGQSVLQDVLDRVADDLDPCVVQLVSAGDDVQLELQVEAQDVVGVYQRVARCLDVFGRAVRTHWPGPQQGCLRPSIVLLDSQQHFG